MQKRILSIIVMACLLIPVVLKGGNLFTIAVYLISLFSLKEFLDIKETKKTLPVFIKFISYILMTLIIFTNLNSEDILKTSDIRVIITFFLTLLIPTVLYHDRKIYSINDAFYLIGGLLFLGTFFHLTIMLRKLSLALLIYLALIAIVTDTYAYMIGSLIGREKLLENISPKKTLEGMVAGTFFAVFIGSIYFIVVIDSALPVGMIIFITLFLSLLGQLGDLTFSAIKRYFVQKDFSNLIPGHGGVLDRLDSLIFIVLGFMLFIQII